MRRAFALLALGLAMAGCGLGAGDEQPGGVELRITRDFGRQLVDQEQRSEIRQGDTVMRLLRSSQKVDTRYGGRFVQSIGGVSGGGPEGRRDWFFFVNGIESDVGAAEYDLHPGDRIHWDYRHWEAAMSIPAIVGAFPEPLVRGTKGKRFPVRVECSDEDGAACGAANRRLREAGVRTSSSAFGADATRNVLRVVVAPWPRARMIQAVGRLTGKPDETGVFAHFSGDRLELLDSRGQTARTAPPGTGLVAALKPAAEEILWVVSGVDDRGTERAARSLDRKTLADAFAVAATPQGPKDLPLQ
ncbi:MAG TPA: DUF4430 domain-containing protein [Thermoleophilaceae bacterium]|nr:DUF4430 domain-containing protein [Thermoleophilaceae bacterium]